MSDFEPLTGEVCVMKNAEDEPIQVTFDTVVKKLCQLSTTKMVRTMFQTFCSRLTMDDVPPIPKQQKITDFNKDLRSISSTSTLESGRRVYH